MKLSRSTDAASLRIITNADGSYTACLPALTSGARIEHCFSTEAGDRVRLVQQLVSLKDGKHTPCGPSIIRAVIWKHGKQMMEHLRSLVTGKQLCWDGFV